MPLHGLLRLSQSLLCDGQSVRMTGCHDHYGNIGAPQAESVHSIGLDLLDILVEFFNICGESHITVKKHKSVTFLSKITPIITATSLLYHLNVAVSTTFARF